MKKQSNFTKDKSMPRVIYERNPLYEVTLQIKFPTILRISSEAPATFQDQIKSKFPNYRQEIQNTQEISLFPNQGNVPPLFRNISSNKIYLFISEDGKYKVSLASSFVSLSTLEYKHWKSFFEMFENVLETFIDIYHQDKFNRIGLRYIDVFDREKLELTDKKWSDLIAKPWIGNLSLENESNMLASSVNEELKLDEGTRRKVTSRLANQNGKQCFVIDSDFIYTNQMLFEDWKQKCEMLHNYSDEFYQTTTTDVLKTAMHPQIEGEPTT